MKFWLKSGGSELCGSFRGEVGFRFRASGCVEGGRRRGFDGEAELVGAEGKAAVICRG